MTYEEMLLTREALLNALVKLEICQQNSRIAKQCLHIDSVFVQPEESFNDVIDQTREAYQLVGGMVFDYEWEQNHTIAENADVLYEDFPF